MQNKFLLIIGLAVLLLVGYLIHSAVTEPVFLRSDRSLANADNEPWQSADSLITIAPIQLGNTRFFLTPRAKYSVTGMLVSKRRYRRGFMSRLSPFDYALIWGKVPEMLPQLKFSQTFRFCFFNLRPGAAVDMNYIQNHISNNHLIPSTDNIRRALKKVRKKEFVRIDGYLVDVIASSKNKGTSHWKTSLKREDTWGGACEIIYITKLQIEDRIFE
ncbi:MAG: hypothetical protein R6V77_05480 [Candidatus Cloacimonadaceae bacterium]